MFENKNNDWLAKEMQREGYIQNSSPLKKIHDEECENNEFYEIIMRGLTEAVEDAKSETKTLKRTKSEDIEETVKNFIEIKKKNINLTKKKELKERNIFIIKMVVILLVILILMFL